MLDPAYERSITSTGVRLHLIALNFNLFRLIASHPSLELIYDFEGDNAPYYVNACLKTMPVIQNLKSGSHTDKLVGDSK